MRILVITVMLMMTTTIWGKDRGHRDHESSYRSKRSSSSWGRSHARKRYRAEKRWYAKSKYQRKKRWCKRRRGYYYTPRVRVPVFRPGFSLVFDL